MEKIIKSILLIDDDEAINYLHKIVLTKAGYGDNLHFAINGKKGYEYLTTTVEGAYPQPDIIFLDINMPVMDGWDFLELYDRLPDEQKGKTLLVMLTSSLNPDDEKKALSYSDVSDFKTKPLTVELIHEIMKDLSHS